MAFFNVDVRDGEYWLDSLVGALPAGTASQIEGALS
jgi:hypothetical protein